MPETKSRYLLLFVLLLGSLGKLCAQSIQVREKYAGISSGTTLTLVAIVKNPTTSSLTFKPTLSYAPFQLVTNLPAEMTIPAGDSGVVTATVYVPRSVAADKNYSLIWRLPNGNTDSISVSVKPVSRVSIQLVEPSVYLRNGKNEADVDVRCSNTGNTAQLITLTVADPQQGSQKEQQLASVLINSFTDSILHFRIRIPGALMANTKNELRITGKLNGNIIATLPVMVYNVASRRSYGSDVMVDNSFYGPGHTFGLYSRMMGTDYHYLNALAGGQVDFSEDNKLVYQADARYYTSTKTAMLTNTYVNYNTRQWDFSAGSIFRSFEMMLSGRGAAVGFKPNDGQMIEVGYVNGDYNMLGSFGDSFYHPTDAFFLHSSFKLSDFATAGAQFIYQRDPLSRKDDALGGGSVNWHTEENKHTIDAGAYTSYTTTGPYEKDGKNGRGYAGTLNYVYSSKRWQGLSMNYYSTPLYAGIQKGVLNLDEKVMYSPGPGRNFFARYNQYRAKPEYISPIFNGYYIHYFLRTMEVGMTKTLSDRWQMGLKPYYYEEETEYNFGTGQLSPTLRAARISGDIRYQGKNGQSFWMNIDAGAGSGNIDLYKNFFAFRVFAGVNYGHFLLNAFIQNGPYVAGEMTQYSLRGKKYQLVSVSPGYTGRLLHNRLFFQVFDYIVYQSGIDRVSNNVSANLVYQVKPKLAIEAGYNRLQNGFGQQLNGFDIGIKKHIGGNKIVNARGIGTLNLFLFEDANGNYRMDAGEQPARGVMVRINQEVFITGPDGKVSFRDMPNGRARVSILPSGGYYASDSLIWVNGKTDRQIPLHRMGVIQGRVVLDKELMSYNTDESVAAIGVTARDPAGKRFVAHTNEFGNFVLYVPSNTYMIAVDAGSLPEKYQYVEAPRQVVLTNDKPVDVGLHVQVQKRPVKVTRFGVATVKN
jgi:hypothetical protein